MRGFDVHRQFFSCLLLKPFLGFVLIATVLSFNITNTVAAEPATSKNCQLDEELTTLLQLLNEARRSERMCGELAMPAQEQLLSNCALIESASAHAKWIFRKNKLSHKDQFGSSAGSRAKAHGYQWSAIAENIARGQTSAEQLSEDWLASPAHCRNIMSSAYDELGLAVKGDYWVALFAAPKSIKP